MLYRRDSITFRLLDAFFRNIGIFLLCVIGISTVVSVALVSRSQSYVASSSIRVIGDTELQQMMGTATLRPWESAAKKHIARFNDLMQDLRPTGFVSTVLKAANLKKPISTDPDVRDPRFQKFREGVFTGTKSKELFSIGLTWEDKEECERLVEAMQKSFIDDVGISRETGSLRTISFLENEIGKYKKRLQDSEDALMKFQSQNAGKLPGSQMTEISQLADLKMQRNYLGITSQDFALKRQAIEDRLKEIKPESIMEKEISTDPLVLSIRELQAKRIELIRQNWKTDSIRVRDVDTQIAQLEAELRKQAQADPTQSRNVMKTTLQDNPEYQELKRQLTQITMDERTQKAQMGQLDQQIAQYEQRIRQLPVAERTLVEKTRDREFVQKTYQDLLARLDRAQLKRNMDKISDTATLLPQSLIRAEPTMSVTKTASLIAGSVLLGLVVGSLMILLREWMDVSLRYTVDAERLLGVPVLAALPESPVLQFPLSTPRQARLRSRSGGNRGSLPPPPGRQSPGI